MPIADEIVSRYRARKGGGGGEAKADTDGDEHKSESAIAAGRALIAAVKRGDAEAVCEAVRAIVDEY